MRNGRGIGRLEGGKRINEKIPRMQRGKLLQASRPVPEVQMGVARED
jgi:hypothetical protein